MPSSDLANGWVPVAPPDVSARLAGWLAGTPGIVRVAIDGAPCASPAELAQSLIDPLRARGRAAVHVRAENFWRDASLRFEHGREDVESYLSWLDADALRREVLIPARARGDYLPSLRDPVTNRSTRAAPVALPAEAIVLVSGALLLGLGLPFDRVIHLTMSPAACARRTPAGQAWTLAAFASYQAEVAPLEQADVVLKLDDPRHPAARGLG